VRLATRTRLIEPSATIELTRKAAQLRAEGVAVIAFTAGEPDFDTPAPITDAAVEALRAGDTRYVAKGAAALQQAICDRTFEDRGVRYEPKQVLVSCGAKHSLANACLALLGPGDEAIVLGPYWLSYPEMIRVAGAEPVIVMASVADGFVPRPEDVRRAVTSKTRAIILNSPSNPTGVVYSRETMEALVAIAVENDLVIIADEIYDRLVYDGIEFVSVLHLDPALKDRVVLVNGASKTFAMTGWRIGWALGPSDVIGAMGAIQSHTTSNPTSFCQTATVEAFRSALATASVMRASFEARRNLMLDEMKPLKKARCVTPGGAFYLFVDVSAYIERFGLSGSGAIADLLLEKAAVVVVPGASFGDDNCIRLSFATSEANIRAGIARVVQALET